MDTDLTYFGVAPIVLGVGLWIAVRKQSRLVAIAALALATVVLFAVGALRLTPRVDREVVVGTISFLLLPLGGSMVGWFVARSNDRPWLVLLLAPIGFFVGFTLGVNLWLACGYSI